MVRMLREDFDRHGPVRGVMHSFTGDQSTATACLEMGLYVSFAGMVTYKTAADLRSVAGAIPANRLLVETDCPYLAPVRCVAGGMNRPTSPIPRRSWLKFEENRRKNWPRAQRKTPRNCLAYSRDAESAERSAMRSSRSAPPTPRRG